MTGIPADLYSGSFTPSEKWCQEAASRFAIREGSAATEVEEIEAIQHDVSLRLWRFLATVARRAATLGNSSLRLASNESFEDDVAATVGERLGFQVPEDRDLLDHLAAEFHTWLAETNEGRRETPWGALYATEEETGMEVAQLAASDRQPKSLSGLDIPVGRVETRLPRPARPMTVPVATPLQRLLRHFYDVVTHRGSHFRGR